MDLFKALKKRGYTFRRHLEEEPWTLFRPTVVDLNDVQAAALDRKGVEGLTDSARQTPSCRQGGFQTFPAFDIKRPVPRRPDFVLARGRRPAALVVAPEGNRELSALARECTRSIEGQYGIRLPVIDDAGAKPGLLEGRSLAVFGCSHQNRLALELALRYRTMYADAGVPGDGGWFAAIHCGLHPSGHNVVQLAAPRAHSGAVKKVLADNISAEGGLLLLKNIHHIHPGPVMAANFPSWEAFTAGLAGRVLQLKGKNPDAPGDAGPLSVLLAAGLDSGGPGKGVYNSAPIDFINDCARYYQLSADTRALSLFRELLFRLADYYLKTPGGASYPADMDFRLGLLVLNFSRLEHDPVFSDEDRLILVNLLLACARSVYEYALRHWPPGKFGAYRHNHQTFPALSLLYAADYFSRFNLPEISAWRKYTEDIFSSDVWHRGKQLENSGAYEPLVPGHAAAYSAFTGRKLSLFDINCFEGAVRRQIITTDNFFRPVDYGDTKITMRPADSVTARFLAAQKAGAVRWFAGEGFARMPEYVPDSFLDFPGIRYPRGARTPRAGGWECLRVDHRFLEETAPGFPTKFAFDKLAFRTGWGDSDHYLLIEGVTGNVSHSHCETSGIVRLNHLARHWIVSNGYGKRPGVTNAAEAFNFRERGPADHNMLVLRKGGKTINVLPMSALLQAGGQKNLLFATTALLGYGGADWFRTYIAVTGKYVLVIDRIRISESGLQKAHVEWNCLGAAQTRPAGCRLSQNGVYMDVTSPSGWRTECRSADQSACWKEALDGGAYPHAAFPLSKIVFHVPSLKPGSSCCLATLLAAAAGEPAFTVSRDDHNRITVQGKHELCEEIKLKDLDLNISADGTACRISFSPLPRVPEPLETHRGFRQGGL